ncbi:unknown [Firmicutes bacterium CAG:822]|nr:unknown [Firmicutes bacterium CAG:822]
MLEKERFLAIKKLAHDIREDNRKIFKSFKKLPFDEAVERKNDFIDSVIENMNIAFSDGEQGREEKQMFRANILIPDDKEFFKSYSEDKNIRNLMNKYAVSIEDIMSKITELNIYGKYIEDMDENDEESSDEPTFVDEMIKISPKEAESLLDEIDNLSSVMEDLDLDNAPKEVKPELLKPEEPINEESTEENDSEVTDESFDDITKAVSNFVNKYEGMQSEIDAKDDKIRKLQLEIEKLDKINNESSTERENINNELSNLKEENTKYHAEVERLQSRNKELEAKLAKSTELLNKIYQSISRK